MPHGYPTPAGPSKHSSVYFIQVGRDGPIKIGYASLNPYDRLFSLQTANPLRLRMLGMIRPATSTLESEVHERFRAFQFQGEWFRPVPQLLRYIAEVATLYSAASYPESKTSRNRRYHFATPEERAIMQKEDIAKLKRAPRRRKTKQEALYDRICELQSKARIYRSERYSREHRPWKPRHP